MTMNAREKRDEGNALRVYYEARFLQTSIKKAALLKKLRPKSSGMRPKKLVEAP